LLLIYTNEFYHMPPKSLIVKDNRLIEASYRLDIAEQRLVLLAIVRARESGIQLTADQWIQVTARDYVDACDLSPTAGYKQLKAAADSLFLRWVQMHGIDEQTGKAGVIKTRWVSGCTYVEQGALVRLQLAPAIIPYLTDLESCFTSYQLKNVVQMSSRYAIRLYELMAQYKSIGTRYIELHDLRDFLDANEKSYDRIQNFKTKVLDISVDQINQYTDLSVMYEPEKLGRSIVGYHFKIDKKQDEQPKRSNPKSKPSPALPLTPPMGLTLAEKNMIKKICAKSGESEANVLAKAQAMGVELFVALDQMTKAMI
jgi:plasmid replication initiation protein